MSNQTDFMPDSFYSYYAGVGFREPEILRELRERTAELPNAQMQIAPEQGQFMALLVKLMRAHKTLENGTFTGYSSLAVALALPVLGERWSVATSVRNTPTLPVNFGKKPV